MPSIISQIDFWEGRIGNITQRLDNIDVSLRHDDLTVPNRDSLITEKEQLSTAVTEHEKTLQSLRKQNRGSMVMSVAMLVIISVIYFAFAKVEM